MPAYDFYSAYEEHALSIYSFILLNSFFFGSGFAVFFQNRKSRINFWWAVVCLGAGVWGNMAYYMISRFPHPVHYRLIMGIVLVAVALSFYRFSIVLLQDSLEENPFPKKKALFYDLLQTIPGLVLAAYFFLWLV